MQTISFTACANHVNDHHEINSNNIILIDCTDIDSIIGKAKTLIDSGKMIYISEPDKSNEDLADMLSIPCHNTHRYNPLLLMGTSIYKFKSTYIFSNTYASIDGKYEPTNHSDSNQFSDVITFSDARKEQDILFSGREGAVGAARIYQSLESFNSTIKRNQIDNNSFSGDPLRTFAESFYPISSIAIQHAKIFIFIIIFAVKIRQKYSSILLNHAYICRLSRETRIKSWL